MSRTNKERELDFLWSISPRAATNSQIRESTGIQPHQQFYMLTQELMRTGRIKGEQRGREWYFSADESAAVQLASPGSSHPEIASRQMEESLTPAGSEELARRVMSVHFGVTLAAGQVPGVPK